MIYALANKRMNTLPAASRRRKKNALFSGGASFAVLCANTTVLLVRAFGVEMVAPITGVFLAGEVVAGFGPLIAFTLHDRSVAAGGSAARSYDPFFFLCAALVELAAVGVVVLARRPTSGDDVDGDGDDDGGERRAQQPPRNREHDLNIEIEVRHAFSQEAVVLEGSAMDCDVDGGVAYGPRRGF